MQIKIFAIQLLLVLIFISDIKMSFRSTSLLLCVLKCPLLSAVRTLCIANFFLFHRAI